MKRIILPVLLLLTVSLTFGQSLRKAGNYFEDGKIDKAKAEIDAYIEKKPNDGEGLYLKAKIYSKIADSAALHGLVTGDARALAFTYFQQALADSGNNKVQLALIQDNFQPIFDMYSGYFTDAVAAFNKGAQTQSKEDFAEAMRLFMLSDSVGQYIRKSEWASIGKIDTVLVLNIGKAALNAKKENIALEYFTKLADAKITGPAGAQDVTYKLPYEWLEMHYREAGKIELMEKYARLGNELYPKEPYFNFVMIEYYSDKDKLEKVLELYQEIVTQHPDSLRYRFRYANEIFGYLYNQDEGKVINNKDKWMNVLKEQLEKAIALDPNHVNSNWLYGQYFYNKGIELRDSAIASNDAQAKISLNEQAKEMWKKAIPYADKAITILEESGTKKDRSRYKSIVNLMQNIYQSLQDEEKLKIYQEKYDKADALFESKS